MGNDSNNAKEDYTFMRAGLGADVVSPTTTTVASTAFVRRAVSLAAVLTRRAADLAVTLAQHRGRPAVSEDDVFEALKHRARTLASSPGLEEDVDAAEREIFDDDDADDADDETETEAEAEAETEAEAAVAAAEATEATEATTECECETCAAVAESVGTWDAWTPEGDIETYLKGAVERSVEMTRRRNL